LTSVELVAYLIADRAHDQFFSTLETTISSEFVVFPLFHILPGDRTAELLPFRLDARDSESVLSACFQQCELPETWGYAVSVVTSLPFIEVKTSNFADIIFPEVKIKRNSTFFIMCLVMFIVTLDSHASEQWKRLSDFLFKIVRSFAAQMDISEEPLVPALLGFVELNDELGIKISDQSKISFGNSRSQHTRISSSGCRVTWEPKARELFFLNIFTES
jgi:hypothetical protein